MAPRRHQHAGAVPHLGGAFAPAVQQHPQQQQQHQQQHHHQNNLDNNNVIIENSQARCCAPAECLRVYNNNNVKDVLIRQEDLSEAVKVICNNDHCNMGKYMHRECFEQFEQSVLTYLKSCGRARSWSERQRQQNLWTKKGYDLAFKACSCRCGRGHLRKDLDWAPPPPPTGNLNGNGNANANGGGAFRDENDNGAKKKKRRNKNTRPALAVTAHHANNNNNGVANQKNDSNNNLSAAENRARTASLSSASTMSGSPPNGVLQPPARRKNSRPEYFTDRLGCGGNGIFTRRLDFSAFNVLPKRRINSYKIKLEDEGNHGNDETRCFILSTLAAHQLNRVPCLLCGLSMPVFDKYPLVDGTFFITPRQHSQACVQVRVEERVMYLSAVCMRCLEYKAAVCRLCGESFDGQCFMLGSMYSYDIFAARPCCGGRFTCNSCSAQLMKPEQRLNYFSDYSQDVTCSHCGVTDTHFIKPLSSCYTLAACSTLAIP